MRGRRVWPTDLDDSDLGTVSARTGRRLRIVLIVAWSSAHWMARGAAGARADGGARRRARPRVAGPGRRGARRAVRRAVIEARGRRGAVDGMACRRSGAARRVARRHSAPAAWRRKLRSDRRDGSCRARALDPRLARARQPPEQHRTPAPPSRRRSTPRSARPASAATCPAEIKSAVMTEFA